MKKKKPCILVTGGGGYIGSVIVGRLLEKDYCVKVLDCFVFGTDPLKLVRSRIDIINVDVRQATADMLDGVDAIIHLAGFSTEPTAQYDPRLTDMVNHLATENLAKLARLRSIKRFIYASTCSIYFTLNTPLNPPLCKESDTVNPISCYSLTKRCAEQVLWGMVNDDFQPTIFRKGTLYGYSPRMRYDLVFNSFVKDAYSKGILTVDAGGEIWRPMMDIQDAAAAYVNCLEMPFSKVGGKIFNVCHQNWRIGDLAQEIKEILAERKHVNIELDVKPYGITRNYKADNTLFKSTFKFKPIRELEDAVLEIWSNLEEGHTDKVNEDIYYGDKWYKKFFTTKQGLKFKRHV